MMDGCLHDSAHFKFFLLSHVSILPSLEDVINQMLKFHFTLELQIITTHSLLQESSTMLKLLG